MTYLLLPPHRFILDNEVRLNAMVSQICVTFLAMSGFQFVDAIQVAFRLLRNVHSTV